MGVVLLIGTIYHTINIIGCVRVLNCDCVYFHIPQAQGVGLSYSWNDTILIILGLEPMST